jgi:alcohol dehydrogenase class IV
VLPHSVRLVAPRAPNEISRLARTLGGEDAAAAVARLTAKTGVTTLRELGMSEDQIDPVVEAVAGRPEVKNTPNPPGRDDLRALLRAALG